MSEKDIGKRSTGMNSSKNSTITLGSHPLLTFVAMLSILFASLAQAQPVLTISKSASSFILNEGSQLVYTLDVSNTGDATATNLLIEDDLSSRVIFESATGGGRIGTQAPKGAVVTWAFASIAAGQSGSVSVITTVDATVLQDWSNTATIVSDQTPLTASNTVTVIVLDKPELTLAKSVSRTDVNTGDSLVYTLQYSNVGGTAANNIVITDTLASNLTFVSADNSGTLAGNVITWTGRRLEPGQSGSVTFTATANAVTGTISNNASIDSDETAPVASNSVSTTVHSETAIKVLTTSSPGVVKPGNVVQFTTQIKNLTKNPAEDVLVTGLIPANATYIANLGGGTFSADKVTWNIGRMGPLQTQSLVVSVRLDDDLANREQITYNSSAILSNGTNAGSSIIIFVTSEPEMTLQNTASQRTIGAGQELTYTLDFANKGSESPATALRDYLPYRTTFVSATDGGTFANGVVSWDIGTVAANASGSVAVTVRTDSPLQNGTVLNNVAEIETIFDVPVSAIADVIVSTLPSLTLSTTTDQRVVSAGSNLSYRLQYQNTGASTANNVVIANILPQSTTFVPPSSGGTESGGVVSWNIGTLAPGQSGFIDLTVLVSNVIVNGTVLHNGSSIRSDNTPPQQALLVDTAVNSQPELQLIKQASLQQAAPGDNVTYTINYVNSGSDAATNVVLTDLLPDMTSFVSASNNGTLNNATGAITWNIGSVPALATGSVSLVVALHDDATDGSVISNTAGIESAETGLAIASAAVTVVVAPINKFSISGNASGLAAGETLQLENNGGDTITVSNDGIFRFPIQLADGAAYSIVPSTQPTSQTCTVSNGRGTLSGANITNVSVSCINNVPTLPKPIPVMPYWLLMFMTLLLAAGAGFSSKLTH